MELSPGAEGLSGLRSEVGREIAYEEEAFQRLKARHRGERWAHGLVVVLVGLMIAAILVQPYVFLLWLFVGFLLYSYNFIIILIPTTTTKMRPGEQGGFNDLNKERRWLAVRLLLRNWRLAVEIGLTVFLGGMVPLAWSFGVIFGVTVVFTIYFGFLVGLITVTAAVTVIAQIGFVFMFYALIFLLEPRSQGVTRLAVLTDDDVRTVRSPLRTVIIVMLGALLGLGLLTSLLGLWALLIPGITVQALLDTLQLLDRLDIVLFALVLAAQLMVMRHIQGYASRRMAAHLLAMRIHALEKIADGLEAIDDSDEEELRTLRKRFFSIAIYDIVKHDIFGLMPIYLVGPRLRYVLDTRVLTELE